MSAITLYNEKQYGKALLRIREFPDEIWQRESELFDSFGETIVHKAASDGEKQCDLLQELLNMEPDLAMATTNSGLLPIHIAGVGQNLRGVQILYDVYPDGIKDLISRGIHLGGTALHVTVFHADFNREETPNVLIQLVHFLVEKYPEALLIRNRCGWTPLDIAMLLHGNCLHEAATDLIAYLKVKMALLPHGDFLIRAAHAVALVNATKGFTLAKVRIVMNHSGCSSDEAIWALKQRDADFIGAVFEARKEEDFEGGRY